MPRFPTLSFRIPGCFAPAACLYLFCSVLNLRAAGRPNIRWLTSEDKSPHLGCHGDEQAQTPHLDRLAADGIRDRNAFASLATRLPPRGASSPRPIRSLPRIRNPLL